MALVRDRCICLRVHEYSETSQILQLFSLRHGVVRAIAKGAHRRTKAGASKFDGGVDLLDVGEAVFTHDLSRELSTLTEWSQREGNLELRKDLRGLYLGLYAAELVGRLIEENDPHPGLFKRLEKILLDLATPRRETAFLAFELELLRESGYLPELSRCAVCGLSAADVGATFFSPERGGVVCRNCEGKVSDRLPVDPRLLRLMQGFLRPPQGDPNRLPQVTRHQTDPINRLLCRHVQHTLGRSMQMGPFVLGD